MATTVEMIDESAEIEKGAVAAYEAHDYTFVSEDGEVVRNNAALAAAAYTELLKAEVTDPTTRSKIAVTKDELTGSLFSKLTGPGEGWDSLSDIEQKVWRKVASEVATLASPAPNGKVQKRFEDSGLVLVKSKAKGDARDCFYVTNVEELIVSDFSAPLKARERKAAQNHALSLDMVQRRIPALAPRMQKELDNGIKGARDAAKAIFQLEEGSGS